jgi:acyl-CoA synthetase (AMP-forming)/AMP-acid ligase II
MTSSGEVTDRIRTTSGETSESQEEQLAAVLPVERRPAAGPRANLRDGFYRTGDLGRLDQDGYLWSSGRLDDMVKVKGATVYPSEVESALRNVAGVREAHVTDVPDRSDRPQVAALVITDLPVEAVRRAARSQLSAFKVPSLWLATSDTDAIPTLASGKVDKSALQKLLAAEGT